MSTDLACFGYLAYGQVIGVATYPAANSGAPVLQITPSLAGDAPITALTARQFDLRVILVSNRVGLDHAGQAVLDTLDAAGVTHQAVPLGLRGRERRSSSSSPMPRVPAPGSRRSVPRPTGSPPPT